LEEKKKHNPTRNFTQNLKLLGMPEYKWLAQGIILKKLKKNMKKK
jgi:hypothetical protein